MAFVAINLNDVEESAPVAEGEYDVQITKATLGESKGGKPMITANIRLVGQPTAQAIRHFIVLPTPDLDAEQTRYRKLDLKRFCAAFNIPTDGGVNVDDFQGAEASVYVTKKVDDDSGNEYNELRLPRLRKE